MNVRGEVLWDIQHAIEFVVSGSWDEAFAAQWLGVTTRQMRTLVDVYYQVKEDKIRNQIRHG